MNATIVECLREILKANKGSELVNAMFHLAETGELGQLANNQREALCRYLLLAGRIIELAENQGKKFP